MKMKREYKDTVYRMLFKEPDKALSLYNGLNGTTYTDVSLLEFNTLENAIYMGMNEELKEKCPALREYVIYVEKVRNYAKSMPLKEAVERAIEECIRDDVLRDFLLKQKAEVVKVSIYEYDEEKEMKLIRADERALGEEIGRAEERKKAQETVIALCRDFGATREQTIVQLMEKCTLDRDTAKKMVDSL